MHILVLLLHVVACLGLIMIVLLQTGKGADLGAAFGGSSQTVFGSQGAGGFLAKLTTAMAVIFMLTSLGLTYLSSHMVQSTVMDGAGQEAVSGELPATAEPKATADEQPAAAEPETTETNPVSGTESE